MRDESNKNSFGFKSLRMADATHRNEEQLIAALEAGEIDPREFLLEARALRDDEGFMSDALRDAFFDRLPIVPAIIVPSCYSWPR